MKTQVKPNMGGAAPYVGVTNSFWSSLNFAKSCGRSSGTTGRQWKGKRDMECGPGASHAPHPGCGEWGCEKCQGVRGTGIDALKSQMFLHAKHIPTASGSNAPISLGALPFPQPQPTRSRSRQSWPHPRSAARLSV